MFFSAESSENLVKILIKIKKDPNVKKIKYTIGVDINTQTKG